MSYKPDYDTTIRTSTVVERHNTVHRNGVDWTYPFHDPEHTAGMYCGDEQKRAEVEKQMQWLRECENGGECYVSDYGGWPRIWQKVLRVCMASCWPYWTPRPVVVVAGTLGSEYYDWRSLTGFRRDEKAKKA